jgi:hypothetical protein
MTEYKNIKISHKAKALVLVIEALLFQVSNRKGMNGLCIYVYIGFVVDYD